MAEWLALPISDHEVPGSNSSECGFQLVVHMYGASLSLHKIQVSLGLVAEDI